MNTVSRTDWGTLCERQLQRALAGDAQAAKWVAEHKPPPTPSGDVGGHDLSGLTVEQLRALAGTDPARIAASRLDREETVSNAIERAGQGRFAPGNRGGPGRPKRVHELRYLSIMHRLCTPETWARITEKAVEQALEGDATARAWLARYCLPEKCDPFAEIETDQ